MDEKIARPLQSHEIAEFAFPKDRYTRLKIIWVGMHWARVKKLGHPNMIRPDCQYPVERLKDLGYRVKEGEGIWHFVGKGGYTVRLCEGDELRFVNTTQSLIGRLLHYFVHGRTTFLPRRSNQDDDVVSWIITGTA